MSEQIIVPIILDPKQGVEALNKLGDAGRKVNDQFTGGASFGSKFGTTMKSMATNAMALVGAFNIMGTVTKALATEVMDLISGKNKLATASKLLAEAQQQAAQAVGDEVVRLQLLYQTATNTNASYAKRQEAIDQLNKKYPELLGNLNMENIGTQRVANSVDRLVKNMIRQAQVAAIIQQIASYRNELDIAERAAPNMPGFINKEFQRLIERGKKEVAALEARAKELMGDTDQNLIGTGFERGLAKSLEKKEIQPEKVVIAPKRVVVKTDKAEPERQFFIPIPDIPQRQDAIRTPTGVDHNRGAQLAADAANRGMADWAEQARKRLEELQRTQENLAFTISNALSPAFEGMFDAIVSKGDVLKAFFQGIGNAVKNLIKQLIQAALYAGVLSLISGGAGGAAKTGFGKAFKGVLGFAEGGLVTGPVSALVGEGMGTNPRNPEVVAPLDKLKMFFSDLVMGNRNFQAGSNMGTAFSMMNIPPYVELRASGRDLVGTLVLENMSQRRNG